MTASRNRTSFANSGGAALTAAVCLLAAGAVAAADGANAPESKAAAAKGFEPFKDEATKSNGNVTIGGKKIAYEAVAGTLVVHPKDWDDAPQEPAEAHGKDGEPKNPSAVASMFYVAYFKSGGGQRPITFIFNGGPGSASLWLHMGAFGPRRVVTPTDAHAPPAPYPLVENSYSLLDASDLVFIDAPGVGFSRIAGKDKEKAFYGIDPDAHAFAEFIVRFLTQYGRWNSPKYLFGESYGTTRSAVLINELENDRSIDFNGVMLLSQILNFDLSPDSPTRNPGIDTGYVTVLPTYAATAWYHHKLPQQPANLESFLAEVEHFAITDYAAALAAGSELDPARRRAVAEKLHEYTGLPVEYVLRADLRIDGGEFRQTLQLAEDRATGRLDTRFSGPLLDPLSQRAEYDPQASALASAYVSAFNEYVRKDLHYAAGEDFKPSVPLYMTWDATHRQPGQPAGVRSRQGSNVMPDLANAMKRNPALKVQLNYGYFDLATPFYQGIYEMHHLPMPLELQKNIEYRGYDSGHMVYAKESSLADLHKNAADFIARTSHAAP